MAWDEWERLKAEAAQGQSTHMQLNQAAPERGGGGASPGGDLTVHQKDLAAIGSAAHEPFQDFGRYGDDARVLGASGRTHGVSVDGPTVCRA